MSGIGAEPSQRGRDVDSLAADRRQRIRSLAAERARFHYGKGANCAESVLRALPEALGRPDLAVPPSIAAAWAGGVADQGCLCGALAAAVMIAGACAGTDEPSRKSRDKAARKMAEEIKAAFEERYDSSCCRVIRRKLEPNKPQSTKHCIDITAEAASLAAAVLAGCAGSSPETSPQSRATAVSASSERPSDRRTLASLLPRGFSKRRENGEARS